METATHIGKTSEFHVDFGELGPGDELGRGAVDSLLSELERPIVLVFCSEEVALDVEEGVGLWVVLESGLQHANGLDLLVCEARSISSAASPLDPSTDSLIPR